MTSPFVPDANFVSYAGRCRVRIRRVMEPEKVVSLTVRHFACAHERSDVKSASLVKGLSRDLEHEPKPRGVSPRHAFDSPPGPRSTPKSA